MRTPFRSLLCLPVLFLAISSHAGAHGFVFNYWQRIASSDPQFPLFRTTLMKRAKTNGATAIAVPLLLCQDSATSVETRWCMDQGIPSSQWALQTARAALAEGMAYHILPIVVSNDGTWRGQFQPSNPTQWMIHYQNRINEFIDLLKLMPMQKPDVFAIGSELNDLYLQNPSLWISWIHQLRNKLHEVKLTTIANWDRLQIENLWANLDYIGVSGYFPLNETDLIPSDSVSFFVNSWHTRWGERLKALVHRLNKKLYFAEVGYPNHQRAAMAPWEYNSTLSAAPYLQRDLFEAFFQYWVTQNKTSVNSIMIWSLEPKTSLAEDSATDSDDIMWNDTSHCVLGKPAEAVVKKYFLSNSD